MYAEDFLAKSLNAQPEAVSKKLEQDRAEAQELFHKVNILYNQPVSTFSQVSIYSFITLLIYMFGLLCSGIEAAGCAISLPFHSSSYCGRHEVENPTAQCVCIVFAASGRHHSYYCYE